jgi:NADPH2:quinone reductase
VIGVVGSARRRALAPSECTHVVLGSEFGDLLPALTDGAGLDIVIDPVGGALRELAFGHLAPFGRLVVLGDASGDDRRLSPDAAWLDSKQVIGLNLGGVAHLVPDRVSAALESVFHWLARGTLHEPAPAIRPLEEASAVHRALEGRTAPPKTVLAVS